MPWTEDQLRAIESRGKNLLVAAAAGSGKTSVLVERVIRLVSEGVNVDEILVVTFTRAASADMREKLTKRFSDMAASGDKRAREQMERLESASISTLHSFCTDVLRSNFEKAGVDPMFRILDDVELKQLTDRAANEALEEAYQAGGEVMDNLDFARGPEKVKSLVLSMHAFLMERPDPEKWFEGARKFMTGDGSAWAEALVSCAGMRINEAIALNDYGVERAMSPLGPINYADAMREDGEVLRAVLTLDYRNMSEALSGFKQITPKRASRKKGEEKSDEEARLADEVSDIRKKVKQAVEKAGKFISLPFEESMDDIRKNAPLIEKIYEIALSLGRKLREYKNEKSAVTFSDLEHLTLQVLSDDRIREGIKAKYEYVFVDEYQDTSDVQEAIVSAIVSDGNLFMVGDVKQSIYRFREAEPKLFLEKYGLYGHGGGNELIVLKQNFRSRKSILDFVNHVFARVMHGNASEIVYDENHMLNPGAQFEGGDAPVEIHIIDKKADGAPEEADEEYDDEAELNDAEREGIVIAGRIRQLMKEDPSIRYRDICVITRVRVNALQYLAASLASEGIPAYADASESYFDALEVMEILSALRLVVNNRRDVDMISVMRSPMFSFTSKDLAMVRVRTNEGSFFDALTALRETDERIDRLFELLKNWRSLSRSMPVSRLIRRILSDTGFYISVGALPGGAQRQANIDQLCSRARAYEENVGGSLSEFLEYALLMRARGDGDSAHVLSENDDVVRLMTSHKSKGLEFPVVFASLLGRRFREMRADDSLTLSRDMGVSMPYVDRALESRRDTISRRAISAVSAMEDRAEELRIFYVTLTRAKSRLILTGTVSGLEKSIVKWKIAENQPDLYANALDIAAAAAMSCPGAEAIGARPKPSSPEVRAYVYGAGGILMGESGDQEGAEAALEIVKGAERGDDFDAKMDEALHWKYPDMEGVYAPVKLTASGLARESIGAFEIPEIAERPLFMDEKGLTPVERGSATHAFLRAVDYGLLEGVSDENLTDELSRQKAEMLESGKLLSPQARAVREDRISRFLLSDVGKRLRASDVIRREWRFNLRMPAQEAMPERSDASEVIVQGSIDLCFEEGGEWVLVDYKTDWTDDAASLKARYAPQLRLYKKALERITGKRVKEVVIAMISMGGFTKLTDDEIE